MAEDLETLASVIGEEVGLAQKAERERVDQQLDLFRRALEVQASRIADLEASVAAPAKRSPAPERTASLLAGRAE